MVGDIFALEYYRYSYTAAVDVDVIPGQDARLNSVTVNLDAAPTTSEALTITINYPAGGEYSTLLLSTDLSTESTTDLVYQPDAPLFLPKDGGITIAYANTDAAKIAISVVMEVEQ